jgi:TonB family protein
MNKAESAGEGAKRRSSASENNASHHLSPGLIRRYVDGDLAAAQMHAVERHCLNCALCSDTLEAFASRSGSGSLGGDFLGKDLVELNKRLDNRLQRDKRKIRPLIFQPWSIAATFLVLLMASIVVLTNRVKKAEVPTETAMLDTMSAMDTLIIYQKPAFVMVRHAPTPDQSRPIVKSPGSRPEAEVAMRKELLGEAKPKSPALALQVPVTTDSITSADHLVSAKDKSSPELGYKLELNKSENQQLAKRKHNPAMNEGIVMPNVVIEGKVHAADDGSPLSGVSVILKGSSQGVTSDSQGQFTLEAPVGSTLVFNFVGMESKEVKVADQKNLDVMLRPDIKALSEVVVVEYGKAKPAAISPEPIPEGGYQVLNSYLSQHLRYPEEAQQMKVKGTVGIEFTVEPDGSLSNFKISKSLGYGCDEEAVRLLQEGPKWKPGRENNHPVRKKVKTRIKFGK